MVKLDIKVPEKLEPLYDETLRYVILEGGRGGSKSHGVATSQLVRGMQRPMLFLDAREIQKSIADSVHHLLEQKIKENGMSSFYRVLETEIRGDNGTKFIFAGLKHNVDNIKSIEDVDECWVEEAQVVSEHTWRTLIPTIRKELSSCCKAKLTENKKCMVCGKDPIMILPSRIIVSYNPILVTDPTYQRFHAHTPKNAKLIHMSFRDNPWFPNVLKQEAEELKIKDYDEYLHVYEGQPRSAVEGTIFATELKKAEDEGRITNVKYDESVPVSCFWDIGWNHYTSIWFYQYVGMQWRMIHFYQNRHEKATHYCKYMQDLGYIYKQIWLPHDSENENIAQERTVKQIVQAAFPSVDVQKLETFSGAVRAGIEASKIIFPLCVFDREACADGLYSLSHYHYKVDNETNRYSSKPDHAFSDGADAFRGFAMVASADQPNMHKHIYIQGMQPQYRENRSRLA